MAALLFAVLAFLLYFSESASAKFTSELREPHYGSFLVQEGEVLRENELELLECTRENGIVGYDFVSGVSLEMYLCKVLV